MWLASGVFCFSLSSNATCICFVFFCIFLQNSDSQKCLSREYSGYDSKNLFFIGWKIELKWIDCLPFWFMLLFNLVLHCTNISRACFLITMLCSSTSYFRWKLIVIRLLKFVYMLYTAHNDSIIWLLKWIYIKAPCFVSHSFSKLSSQNMFISKSTHTHTHIHYVHKMFANIAFMSNAVLHFFHIHTKLCYHISIYNINRIKRIEQHNNCFKFCFIEHCSRLPHTHTHTYTLTFICLISLFPPFIWALHFHPIGA